MQLPYGEHWSLCSSSLAIHCQPFADSPCPSAAFKLLTQEMQVRRLAVSAVHLAMSLTSSLPFLPHVDKAMNISTRIMIEDAV